MEILNLVLVLEHFNNNQSSKIEVNCFNIIFTITVRSVRKVNSAFESWINGDVKVSL
jgi:hypothetical protein